ncbi:phosphatidylinositol 3-kinase C2 domain-containing subunit gamma [Paramormyrops kingsleyae]|uniref:phosphatidylinositol 3-kinase C2 domain-containing subunit gamma n=1 Tax=Paramormyrops kingsleyae TaxID=1676925 RepID=UPI003B96E295
MDPSQEDTYWVQGRDSDTPLPLMDDLEMALAYRSGIFLDNNEQDIYNSVPVQHSKTVGPDVPTRVQTAPLVPPPSDHQCNLPPVPPRPPKGDSAEACLARPPTLHEGGSSSKSALQDDWGGNPPLPPRTRALSEQPVKHHRPLSCISIPSSNPPSRLGRANTTDDTGNWTLKLIDTAEEGNDRLSAFRRSVSGLMQCYPYSDRTFNPGLVWGRISPFHPRLQEDDMVDISMTAAWLPHPVPFTAPLNRTVRNLIEVLCFVLEATDADASQHLLKFCDSEEFLKNEEMLGMHESILTCQRLRLQVSLRLLHQDHVKETLARDHEDDSCPFDIKHLLGSAFVFNTSRTALETHLKYYSKEIRQLIQSQYGNNVVPIAEEVQTISSLLCGVSTRELEDAIGELQRTNHLRLTCVEYERVVLRLDHALSRLLHTFFSNFDSDYRSEQPFRGPQPLSADVANNDEILQLDLAAFYKLEPSWIASLDYFCISCALTYGSKQLCEAALSENISTILSLGNKLQCSRKMSFPIQINSLPYESMLTFRLLGSKQGKTPELLRWAVLPLFADNKLVSGTVLLSMSALEELTEPPTPGVSDSHRQATGVILQVEFPDTHRWVYKRPKSLACSLFITPPFEELHKKIVNVSQKHSVSFLTDNEKAFLWSKRHSCNKDNTYLHLLLSGAPQWTPEDLSEIYGILEHWPLRNPEEALLLLSDCFQDQNVRRVAVQRLEQLSDVELEGCLPQLVQALKLEWNLNGPLILLLLSRSLQSVRMAHQLYWLLEDARETNKHYQSWYSKVQAGLRYCCGRQLRQELENEHQLVKLLMAAAERIRMADKAKRKDILKHERIKMSDFFKGGVMCRLPLDPALLVRGVDIEACKFYNSNAAPLGVAFINADSLGRNISIICKTGENLGQDMLVLQAVRAMDRIWLESGLDMRMVTYRCVATGRDQGLLEVIPEAVTLAQIQQEWGLRGPLREDTLEKWFHMWNRTEEEYEEAVMNFLHSCAGWCVATFILGICDRHNDNIMLKHSGHMFHIDFGKIMGNAQKFGSIKRDRCPFIFTSEMLHLITVGGKMAQRFQSFVELCCKAYNAIRRRCPVLLSLLELMTGAGLPEMKNSQDLQYVYNNLRPQDSDLEAASYFTKMIKDSLCLSLPVKFNFLIHSFGQSLKARQPAQPVPSPHTNIQEAVIQKFSDKGRTVTYELHVKIEDGYLTCERTFSEFEMIHKELQKKFVESLLPEFPGWYKMSFTASRRMTLLNKYLKELFNGPCKGNEVVCSLFLDGPKTHTAEESKKDLAWPSKPQIQLCMTYKDLKLTILIKHLKNIRMPNGSCPDAYVVTRLRPDPGNCSKKKTNMVRNSSNPTFNELIEYSDVQSLQGKVLELHVKSRGTFLAATNIWLADRRMGTDEWFPLGSSSV